MEPPEDLDWLLRDAIQDLFWDGEPLHEATALMAAAGWRFPTVGRFGDRRLALSRQALAGYARLAPPRSRLPLPPQVLSAIADRLITLGEVKAAVALKLGESAYLRPGELCALRRYNLVLPHWTLAEAKRRGRWAHDRSLKRYAKGGRLAEQMSRLTPTVQARCYTCHARLGEILRARFA